MKEIVDYVIAGTSVLTAAFVGWQAYLLNQTLNDPFEANLQNRQIETCIDFMSAYEVVKARNSFFDIANAFGVIVPNSADGFGSWEELDPEAEQPNMKLEGLSMTPWGYSTPNSSDNDITSALSRLKLFSNSETRALLDEVQSHYFRVVVGVWGTKDTGIDRTATLAEFNAAATEVVNICYQNMSGELTGLL